MLSIPPSILSVWEKGLQHIGPDGVLGIAAAVFFAGLIICFFGQRLFRLVSTICVMLACTAVALYFSLGYDPTYQLGLALGGLVIGAAVGWALYWVWIAGFGIAVLSVAGLMISRTWEIALIAGLAGGLLAVVFRRMFLILATAITGGAAMAWGGYLGMLCLNDQAAALQFAQKSVIAVRTYVPLEVMAAALGIAVLGLSLQFFMYRRWRGRQVSYSARTRRKTVRAAHQKGQATVQSQAKARRAAQKNAGQREAKPTDGMTPAQRKRYEAIHGKASQAATAGGAAKVDPPPAFSNPPKKLDDPRDAGMSLQPGKLPQAQPALQGPVQKEDKSVPGLGHKPAKGARDII